MIEKKIYQVGGCVRDNLIGITSSDIDLVAVGYSADDFSHLECIGKDFPVFLTKEGNELALARTELKVSNGYNGFEAITSNVSIEDDLKRRDLTINSIAYDESTKTHIDPYGGISDIKNKILRHTSSAFKEDPLRVLRLARFQAKFTDFIIHETTKEFVQLMKEELRYLQKDRVFKEVKKVLDLEYIEVFFTTLLELGVLNVIFPNIYNLSLCNENSKYHQEKSVFTHTMMVLKQLKDESNLLKLTALYHDIAKPMMYDKSDGANAGGHDNIKFVEPLIDMDISNKIKKKMLLLISNHLKIFNLDKIKVNKIATFFESYKKDRELFIDQLIFARADTNGRISTVKKHLDDNNLLEIFEEISRYSPLKWMNEQENRPSGEVIKQHIHNMNIYIIKKYDIILQKNQE